ncbi:MAG: 50S ribosomal protein L25 [Candidatus Omnitrophica bacterium]|nr:50S ribosomal protein L25 [Candidatus Omnitrophota bacterium]
MTEREKKHVVFVAKPRDSAGKSVSRTLRRANLIPGILYGAKEETRLIAVERKSAERNLRHSAHNIMADLVIEQAGSKSSYKTIVKEIQVNPITGEILHLDFYHIGKNQPVRMSIPVKITGESEGVKEGGILEQELREIEVEGLADAIPENIEINISGLKINESIFVKDIKFPEGVRPLVDFDHVVVTVLAPKAEQAPAPEEAVIPEEAQQPKVITQEIAEERRKEKEAKKEAEKGS